MDPERARTLLTDELERLDGGVGSEQPAPGDDRSAAGLDFGDAGSRATETMDHDLAVGARDGRRERVRAALSRLDRGEYGRCAVCGAEIDDERLEIRPETDRCREHPEDDAQMPGPVEP
ncbi:TraR/DksA C4-type zinc finger protein [Pseudonocardia sp. C8]|uniref:TraR/DksA family transcriptional regulator n=1 Tax=Pseudonocardia sp. C8 TaxID=2762759 RepID=UPI001642DA9A|nr:TraR/DksA C4-type zinc finger protein [Pseudonocardia sp. C8]MBC3191201.1 TraR/DksA C4-type zinc finger protein [Pseudonocardia sp. C8]